MAWIDGCPVTTGRKIYKLLCQSTNAPGRVLDRADAYRAINSADGETDAYAYEVLTGDFDDSERLDVVAAVLYEFDWLAENDRESVGGEAEAWKGSSSPSAAPWYDVASFIETVNDLLLGARVDWHWDRSEFRPRGNSQLHAEVVRPAAVMLSENPKFAKASAGFETALTRLAENKPDVAVTDAASAVQEFFRALGVKGNSLPDQVNAAQRTGVLSAPDRHLLKPLSDWLNADRADHGNAHHHREGEVTRADAWLAIHVAGALMVRLSNEEPRDSARASSYHDHPGLSRHPADATDH